MKQIKSDEFMIVKHSYLNNKDYDIARSVEDISKLEKHLNGRTSVPCFEGDLVQVRETGEIVLTHQNWFPLTKKHYEDLRSRKIAAPLNEVLDKFGRFKQCNPDQKVVLCFEPKIITADETVYETVYQLREHGLKDAYFDTFFSDKLKAVEQANYELGTEYQRSLHLLGNVGNVQFQFDKVVPDGFDITTTPEAVSFGKSKCPTIYGAVGSIEMLEKISEDQNAIGAYARLTEGSGIKGLIKKGWNSITNTEKLRRIHLSLYEN
jgi:hypothetical protein